MMRAAVAAVLLAGCADLPPMPPGVCGNAVVEEGEQCDTVEGFGGDTHCQEPGSTNACRYVCDSDGTPACPDGWSCGDDGACRHASGTFAPAPGSPWRFFADGFVIGDIDGDDQDDLIGHRASGIHVRFGSEDGQFRTDFLRNTDIQVGLPAIADLDGDDRLDIIQSGAGGLTGFLGQGDRTLAPIVYGSFDLPVESKFVMIRPSNETREHALVITDEGMIFRDRNGDALGPLVPLPEGAVAGFINGEIPVDGETFALPLYNGTTFVYTAAKGDGGANEVELVQTLTVPGENLYGARFADVDGDGLEDLMISVNASGTTTPEGCAFDGSIPDKVAVARANGFGGYEPAVIDDSFDDLIVACCSARSWPVAVGNLNGDDTDDARRADAIGDQAICIRSGTGYMNVGGNPSGGFYDSVIADFNRDGANDIAAADTSGVTFFLGNDSGYFTLHRQETFLQPVQLRTGDFDGDFVTDLAYALPGLDHQRVAVSYGQLQGGPAAPLTMARFAAVHRLEPSDLGGDLPTDLVIHGSAQALMTAPGGGAPGVEPGIPEPSLSFLFGSSQRGMVSPLPLQGIYAPDQPLAAMVGDFDQTGANDILAVADPWQDGIFGRRFWLLPGGEGAQFDPDDAMTDVLEDGELIPGCASWMQTDLDGAGGPPDLLAFDACRYDFETGLPADGALFLGTVAVSAGVDVTITRHDLVEPDFESGQGMVLADANGDGLDDLIVFFGSTLDVGETVGAPPVAIYLNTGGGFDFATRGVVSRYFADAATEVWVAPVDAAPINVDADPELELAILTTGGLFVADTTDGVYRDARLAIEAQVFYGAKLRAADVDRDGLSDLVYVSNGEAHVWRSVPEAF